MKKIVTLLLAAGFLLAGCAKSDQAVSPSSGAGKRLRVALMPKSKGNAYFISCRRGADRAAKDLGVDLIFDGPTSTDPAKQNEIIENWIDLGVDVIAAACENKEGISTALRKARSRGIKVITFDSDAEPDARSFFVNQATPKGIGDTMMDECARLCHGRGQFALIVASLTAANQREWEKYIEARRQARYPGIKMVAMRPCDDQKDRAQAEATALMAANPNLDAFICICTPSVPGAAEAVKQAGKVGRVKIVGLGLPSENKRYVKEGVLENVILWKTEDLGYLTVCTAVALAKGTLHPGDPSVAAGPLGRYEIRGDNVLLGKLAIFDKTNIDQAGF